MIQAAKRLTDLEDSRFRIVPYGGKWLLYEHGELCGRFDRLELVERHLDYRDGVEDGKQRRESWRLDLVLLLIGVAAVAVVALW